MNVARADCGFHDPPSDMVTLAVYVSQIAPSRSRSSVPIALEVIDIRGLYRRLLDCLGLLPQNFSISENTKPRSVHYRQTEYYI